MRPTYSWVIPIYNEAASLPELIPKIHRVMRSQSYEIICVNDGSTDATAQVLKKLSCQTITLTHSGKWPAVSRGLKKASGRFIITIDADLQDDPLELKKLLRYINNYHLVSGWRHPRRHPLYKIIISRIGNWLISIFIHHRFHDLNSPFKIFRRDLLKHLPQDGNLFRFSLLFAYKLGFRTLEIKIRHHPRKYGISKFKLTNYFRILYDLINSRL